MFKTCLTCKQDKLLAEFAKDQKRKDGLCASCRECRSAYYRLNNRSSRNASFKARYGITLEQFEKMEQDQLGACAMCGNFPARRLNVDHNHTTLKVRGLLCTKCNNGLGFVEDAAFMERARRYLAEYEGETN